MSWLVEFNAERSALFPLIGGGWRPFGWERLPNGRIVAPRVYSVLSRAAEDRDEIRRRWPDVAARIREA